MFFEEFQDGCYAGHLDYQNGTILASLNRHVAPMPPTNFQLSWPYHSEADVIRRFSKWPPWLTTEIFKMATLIAILVILSK